MVEAGRWYVVLDPSWIDAVGARYTQPYMYAGQLVQVSSIDADGDVTVNIPLPNGRIMTNAATVAPQHLKPHVLEDQPTPDGYGTLPLF